MGERNYIMSFTPITTQEDFDKAIKDRLDREKKTITDEVTKKYAGTEEWQEQQKKLNDQLGEQTKAIEEAAEASKKNEATITELTDKVKKYETASVKARIANEVGLQYQLASRLSGEDEEAIKKDAESLVKLMGNEKGTPPPLAHPETEPTEKGSKNAALKGMLQNMKGEE